MYLFVIMAGIALFIGSIFTFMHLYESNRAKALKEAASALGLSFSRSEDEGLHGKVKEFPLFKKGVFRKMTNVMQRKEGAGTLTVFEYKYHDAMKKRDVWHTLMAMESDAAGLPGFSLQPERIWHKLGPSVSGYRDIDFDDHPEFSKAFLLKGEDEVAIRRLFDREILDLLAGRAGCCVDSAPGILVYRNGGRWKPKDIDAFMREGSEILSALQKQANR